mgnify:CR=1 FL=1
MFNSLPAEINDWDMIFRERAGLLCDLEDTVQFLAQCRHILSDLVVGDFSVDLGRGDMFMPQHLRERLQRHAVHQADRRGIGMTCGMESDRLRKEKQR